MTLIQMLMLGALMLLGFGILASSAIVGRYIYLYQLERRSQKSLLRRLDRAAQDNRAAGPERRKFSLLWSRHNGPT